MLEPIQFTYRETQILLSSMTSQQARLTASGDYPEKAEDDQLLKKLRQWALTHPADINIATRGPRE